VQDQPVVGIAAEGLRHDLFELRLDFLHRFARREAGAIADPEHMRVDCECLFAEGGVEHHVGGFAADPGKRLQLLARSRHLALVPFDQRTAEGDDILRLGVEQADRLDRLAQGLLAERHHLLRSFDPPEKVAGRKVDARIRRLRRQHDGHQQRIRIRIFELGRRRGVRLRQAAEKFEHLLASHKEPITSRIE